VPTIALFVFFQVRYTANGFVEKNMESLSNELKDLGAQSSIQLTQKVYSCGSNNEETVSPTGAASRRSSIRGVSVASQFRLSLQALVEDLECTQPHYVRCIKPNLAKAPNNLDSGEVLRQLRYSGMMEAIRIRREGYALREDHESFYNRFSVLLNREDFGEEAGIEQLVSSLSKRLNVTDADWQIGHSKVFLRRELADKLERLAKLKVHVAARTVSRFGRFVAQRRAASVLTSWGRFRLHMLETYRRHHATSKIIAAYRRYKQASRFATMRSVAVFIQSQQRRKIAVERVRHIRDPYVDMSYRDMKKLCKTEQARLDKAVAKKNFAVAAEIESLLATVMETMEAKKPFTRSMLEAQIDETQSSLDDALARKAYQECEPLQAKLEELKGRRPELPTLEELKEDLISAEADVAAAAQRRDFPAAAAGQARIDEAKKRLEDATAAENADVESDNEECDAGEKENYHGIESRADLEKEIASLNQQIKSAISSKDFQTATTLQITLEQREKLRLLFPTVKELKDQLSVAKDKMEKALVKKDFIKAGDLDKEVAELESKLAAEIERIGGESSGKNGSDAQAVITGPDGEDQVFDSRFELEKEIALSTCQVEEAVVNKEFKKAKALQARVDDLLNLRALLPSVAELESLIREMKGAMEKAIHEKNFTAAEYTNTEIEKLEEKLRVERSNVESHHVSPQKGGDVASVRSTPVVRPRVPLVAKATSVSEGVKPRHLNTKPPSQIGIRVATDDMSEVSSVNSLNKGFGSKSKGQGQQLKSLQESVGERPVSKLRPKKPLLSALDDSIASMTQMLANKRGDASLVVGADGGLAGIITDTDITRRVVAKNMDIATTRVSAVMTPNPTCVCTTDSAMDALQTMVENHFRHLPVVDDEGSIVGLLDIAKCLNDAISKLERSTEKNSNSMEEALKQVAGLQGAGGAQASALQALLGPLMAQAFGNQTSPTLRSLLAGKPSTIVGPESSLRDAGVLMAERRKAALVVEDGNLVGIFGFKDMMNRAVAKELSLDSTAVSAVMTPDPKPYLLI
jgi:myosin heavy subunit/predicted transcriptional regulator